MAVLKSTQVTNLDAIPVVYPKANEVYGRLRRNYFDFTVPTGDAAVSDTVQLTKIPAGARIMGGRIDSEAMSTAGGAASIQLGDGTTAAKFLGTTTIDAIAQADFNNTQALAFGEAQTAELILTATVITEAWAATKILSGYIDFVVD